MANKKIVIPTNEKHANSAGVIRLTDEALRAVTIVASATGWSIKRAASMIIEQAFENGLIEYENEE